MLAIKNLDAFRFTRSFLAHVVPTSLPVIFNEVFWALGMVAYKIAYSKLGISAIATSTSPRRSATSSSSP